MKKNLTFLSVVCVLLVSSFLVVFLSNSNTKSLIDENIDALSHYEWGGGYTDEFGRVSWYEYQRVDHEYVMVEDGPCLKVTATCHGHGNLFCNGYIRYELIPIDHDSPF